MGVDSENLPKIKENFAGDQKQLDHFVLSFEKKLIATLLPLVPSKITTAHLTLFTVLWCMGVIVSGYLSSQNIHWLWAFSGCIFGQYVTDMLDGAVGRERNEGLITWGFYMDHFLDYMFLSSMIIGYGFLLPPAFSPLALACLMICGGFMVHAFLDFGITNNFKISFNRFGVSEVRFMIIAFNTVLIFLGKELLIKTFPFIILLFFVALVVVVYRSQVTYRLMDMKALK